MTLKEIAEIWLKEHGYDGLYHPLGMCSCTVGEDTLEHCTENACDCEPGYRHPLDCKCKWCIEMGKYGETNIYTIFKDKA